MAHLCAVVLPRPVFASTPLARVHRPWSRVLGVEAHEQTAPAKPGVTRDLESPEGIYRFAEAQNDVVGVDDADLIEAIGEPGHLDRLPECTLGQRD